MKNKIYLTTILSTTFLFGSTVSLDDRITQLENIVKQQQKTIIFLKESKVGEDELEDIDERIDIIETKRNTDKIHFGLGFKTRVESYSITQADKTKYSDNNIWSSKVNFNLKSKITDYMKFTGKMTMYKYWADSTRHSYEKYDSMQGRVPSDSSIYLERAYVDWTITNKDNIIPITLTIGRQPSSDGSSYKFSDNTSRKGTYSALVFDGAADGIVTTFNYQNILIKIIQD